MSNLFFCLNADRMNQRRVRVLPRSESRRGEYAANRGFIGLRGLGMVGEVLGWKPIL